MKKRFCLILVAVLMIVGCVTAPKQTTYAAENLSVEQVQYLLDLNGYWAIQVHFDKNIDVKNTESVESDINVRNYIKLNGFTLGEIADNGKDAEGNKVDQALMVHRMDNNGDGHIVLHIFVSDKVTVETGGIKPAGEENVLQVLPGFTSVLGDTVTEEFIFYNKGAGWIEKIDTSGIAWGDLNVVSVSGPTVSAGENVSFFVTFDKALSNKALLHINASAEWLLAVSQQNPPPFYYSAEELQLMQSYGIMESYTECIYFNGVSLNELMQKETDAAQRPGTIMVHIGGTGDMSVMEISFGGTKYVNGKAEDGANKITDLEQEFILEFRAGIKTVTVLETKETVRFRYAPASGKFVKETQGELSSETGIQKIFYNGYRIGEGERIPLKGQEFSPELLSVILVDTAASFKVNEEESGICLLVTATDGTQKEYRLFFDQTSSNIWLWIGIGAGIAVVVACAAVLTVCLLKRRKSK